MAKEISMSLYLVTFTEQGGYRYPCRIRAATGANPLPLAVRKVWGMRAFWQWLPGSDTEGRVYERCGPAEAPVDVLRTGVTTVTIAPARRRPRVS